MKDIEQALKNAEDHVKKELERFEMDPNTKKLGKYREALKYDYYSYGLDKKDLTEALIEAAIKAEVARLKKSLDTNDDHELSHILSSPWSAFNQIDKK